MTQSFNFFSLNAVISQEELRTTEQLTLLSDTESNMETAVTTISLSSRDYAGHVDRYLVEHDFLCRLTHPGRARGKTFREYVTKYTFPGYATVPSADGTQLFVLGTKSKVARDCVNRLNTQRPEFRASPIEVDFALLRPWITYMHGAWFSNLKAANISSAGLFGPHVELSSEFQHVERLGQLSALMLNHVYREAAYTVTITKAGGIVLYDSFDVEESALLLVLDVWYRLVCSAASVKRSQDKRGDGRSTPPTTEGFQGQLRL